jgi:MYXO-CTERM domain-containing protein
MASHRGSKRGFAFWGAVAGLLPLAYASSYVAVGAGPAEGCSGAPAEEAVGVLYLSSRGLDEDARVDRNGFFPFWASIANVDKSAALDAITVEVRDESGELVPGETVFIKEERDDAWRSELTLGWSASEPRRGDEVLAFHATATNSVDSVTLDVELSVVDVEPELALPSFEVTEWTRVKYDAGPEIGCHGFESCSESSGFGSELHDARRMTLQASSVMPEVLVLWEFEWVPVSGKGNRVYSDPDPFTGYSPGLQAWLTFAAGLEEYCVRLRGRDLRTADTREQEICASPSADSKEVTYDSIRSCFEPPEGFLERWCLNADELDVAAYEDECAPYLMPSAGSGGSGGASSGTGGSGASSSGGTASGGSSGKGMGSAPEPPLADAGAPMPDDDAGSNEDPPDGAGTAGSPGDDGEAGSAGKGSKSVLTEGGCGCRSAGSNGDRNSVLGSVGLGVLGLGLALRRRRRGA